MKQITGFEECIHKIRYIERISNERELSEVLEMPLTTLRDFVKKDKIPVDRVLAYCNKRDLDINWLLLEKVG